ncbi:MAG: ribonuclease Y, partial [Oscillospiraceae bacterium]|nr:ribonuclease Y [Oscillospiraceae bacterium]
TENLEQKELEAKQKAELIEARLAEIEQMKQREIEKLEVISGLSTDAARTMILERLDAQLAHEKALKINHYENELKENCEELARDLLTQTIARCAADHAQEAVVSVVPLPSDEMKGRIIGREGRNIRALETATGVDVIIDDTPEAITLSSFDPVRREVARQTLEKLIADGRIHPARIEEMVEKARRDVDLTIKKEGEKAVMDAGVHGLHPELIKLIGRLKYRTSYGQNVLKHSLEVSYLSGLIAGELGMDVTLAKRAGLLHDIGKGLDHEYEGTHVSIGVEIAKKYRESAAVIHAIQAHHNDIEPKTPLAFVVMAADAISAARPGARRENLENYIKRLEKLEEISNSFNGVEKSFAIQAGREVRIMVKPEVIDDDNLTILARDIVAKIENELDYPGQIKVNVIRENRAIDFAK